MNSRIFVLPLLFSGAIAAADLKPETVEAWDNYVRNSYVRSTGPKGRSFLRVDDLPNGAQRARSGEVIVHPMSPHMPQRVPSGLIHHWIGVIFIPNSSLSGVLSVTRDYDRYKERYHPAVIGSEALRKSSDADTFSLLLMNRALVVKSAYDTEYEASYVQVDPHRWYSVSHSTRVQEIAGYGLPGERKLNPGSGNGYIWRVQGITRFEERDGGVYVEMEAMVLSRDIPATLHWVVDPIVTRASRSALQTSLRQTQDAVTSNATAGLAARSFKNTVN